MGKQYIINVLPAGQLGNRLLQMSNLIAFAKRKNAILLNPGFDRFGYARYFDFTELNALCAYPLSRNSRTVAGIRRRLAFAFHRLLCNSPFVRRYFFTGGKLYKRPGLLPSSLAKYLLLGTADTCNLDDENDPLVREAGSAKYVFIGGWMLRAQHSFDEQAEEFRELFTPKAMYLEKVNSIVEKARAGADILVGVHIRHGDYKGHFGGIYYYSIDVYKKKMQEMLDLFSGKKVRFLVCSNAGLKEIDFSEFSVTCGTGEQIEDMYSLSGCDYLAGPPSTFTAWASFYGKRPLAFIMNEDEKITLNKFRIFNSRSFIDLDRIFFR